MIRCWEQMLSTFSQFKHSTCFLFEICKNLHSVIIYILYSILKQCCSQLFHKENIAHLSSIPFITEKNWEVRKKIWVVLIFHMWCNPTLPASANIMTDLYSGIHTHQHPPTAKHLPCLYSRSFQISSFCILPLTLFSLFNFLINWN